MLGSFFGPIGHLLFDDTGIDTIAVRIGPFTAELPKERLVPPAKGFRGSAVTFGQTTLQNLKTTGKREAVRIKINLPCRLEHQGSDNKMSQGQRIQFLNDPLGRFASQMRRLGSSPRILVCLLFVKHEFVFPTFVIQTDELHGRIAFFIQQVRHQNVFFLMTDTLRIVELVAVISARRMAVWGLVVLLSLRPGDQGAAWNLDPGAAGPVCGDVAIGLRK